MVQKSVKFQGIFANTFLLYVRHFVLLLCNLLIVRILLRELGEDSFSDYLLVWSIVLFLAFFSNTLSSTASRFFSFELGQESNDKLEKLFVNFLIVYCVTALLLAFIYLIFSDLIIQFIFEDRSSINSEIKYVLAAGAITVIAGLMSNLFISIFLAQENFNIYLLISILEVLIKLIVASFLAQFVDNELLTYFSALAALSIFSLILYSLLSFRFFEFLSIKTVNIDRVLINEIIQYAGWTLFGQFTTILKNHGTTILTGLIFNPGVVVARGLSVTVGNNIFNFCSNFTKGVYPRLVKLWSSRDLDDMYDLLVIATLITFCLVWIISAPIIFNAQYILDLWLVEYPDEAILFVQTATIENIITAIAIPIMIAARANGDIKKFELVLGSIQLIGVLIMSLCVLKTESFQFIVWMPIVVAAVMFPVRLMLTAELIKLPVFDYLIKCIIPITLLLFLVIVVSQLLAYLVNYFPISNFLSFLLFTITNLLIVISFFIANILPRFSKGYVADDL